VQSQDPGGHRLALAGGLFLVAAAFAFVLLRPIQSASIGPDAAAPVIHFQHIAAGHHLEGYLGQTPKPLLTVIYGAIYTATHDWRPVVWVVIAVFALCVVLGWLLGQRIGGSASGAFVAVAVLVSPALLTDISLAYAVVWALLAWLAAGLAVTAERPRYAVAGAFLAIGVLARLETLIMVAVAAVALFAAEGLARTGRSTRPARGMYGILLGFLALPVMLVHDWLLTGDPLFWTKIAELNSVGAANIRGPLHIAAWLVLHVAGMAPLVPLAALGALVLVRQRRWPLAIGLLALGPGVAAFLVLLGARGTFVSARYLAPIDLSLLFTAGLGLTTLDVPIVRRWLGRTLSLDRSRVVVPLLVGAFAALAFAPNGLIDATTRHAILNQVQLHANERRAIAAIRVELAAPSACFEATRSSAARARSTVIVPSRLRAQAVVDLDLPLTDVAKPGGITMSGGLPAAGQIVYHDRLDGQTSSSYAVYEIKAPVTKGAVRLVPLLADATRGLWVIRVDDASCS
jgi:hypothetical protein